MYCSHCGYKIDEEKIENKQSSLLLDKEGRINSKTKICYVCPQCGHIAHDDLSEEDIKSLSRAAHAQVQRGNNSFSRGMTFLVLGLIFLAIAIIFFVLAKKPANQYQLVFNCIEFYVFAIASAVTLVLLILSIIFLAKGIKKKRMYTELLKDINNKTFVQ